MDSIWPWYISGPLEAKLAYNFCDKGGQNIVVICHGSMCTKNDLFIPTLQDKLALSSIAFDFSGNGESSGWFSLANYEKEM